MKSLTLGMKTLTLALTAVALTTSRMPAQDSGIPVGDKAPAAVAETLDGRRVDLAQYIGKTPILLEFWATWCPSCEKLEPALIAAHRKYGRQMRFIGIAVSVNQSPQRVSRYAKKHKLAHDILFDRTGDATTAYDVPATSYIVVIDRKGTVVYTGVGGSQDLEAAIKLGIRD